MYKLGLELMPWNRILVYLDIVKLEIFQLTLSTTLHVHSALKLPYCKSKILK